MNTPQANRLQIKSDRMKSIFRSIIQGRIIIHLINWIYWKTIGEVTFFGRFNGTPIIICYKKGKCERLWIAEGGSIENMHIQPTYIPPEEFKGLMSIYNGKFDNDTGVAFN